MSHGARNTADGFGWVTRLIHWLMAIGILAMLALGTTIESMAPSLSNLWLFGLHKSIGVSLLLLVLLRLLWHRVSPPPPTLSDRIPKWQITASHGVHRGFYILLLAVPMTGWVASGATGLDVVVFGSLVLPPLAPVSETWEKAFFAGHGILTKLLVLLLILHIVGALQRHFLRGDRTLRRMIRG